jgi:hypothetical protein
MCVMLFAYLIVQMVKHNNENLIPENLQGKEITASASANFEMEDMAVLHYKFARERLLLINDWHSIAGTIGARFQLTDGKGTEAFRQAEKGDHIRIDIPGPGSQAGEGYDWVRIEEIREVNAEKADSIAILVRPASNPCTDNGKIAHFYAEHSTSTFVVRRENNKVTASVYDRNIEANQETKGLFDKVRNAIVGLSAKHGFSKLQWQVLVEGLLGKVE